MIEDGFFRDPWSPWRAEQRDLHLVSTMSFQRCIPDRIENAAMIFSIYRGCVFQHVTIELLSDPTGPASPGRPV